MDDIYFQYPAVDDMDRGELESFISEVDLDIDPDDYPNTRKLRKAVLELLGLD
jgi:DNA primase catalytic subunit